MRDFKCYECNHTWRLPFGEGGRGANQSCPECGSKNIHREGKPGDRGRGGRWFRGRRWGLSYRREREEAR